MTYTIFEFFEEEIVNAISVSTNTFGMQRKIDEITMYILARPPLFVFPRNSMSKFDEHVLLFNLDFSINTPRYGMVYMTPKSDDLYELLVRGE